MESQILSGAPVRDAVFADLQERLGRAGRTPGLAVILVGEDPASTVYVRSKGKACEKLGFHHLTLRLPADIGQDELMARVDELNEDPLIDGILVQLPLPGHLDAEAVQLRVDPGKDVDGFHPVNLGRLLAGNPGFIPCTPKGVIRLLQHYGLPTAGKSVAMVGRSVIVGRPLAQLLALKGEMGDATVTLCHSATPDLGAVTSRADIVIAAIGSPEALTREHVAEGAVVVDVGINRVPDSGRPKGYRIAGDVHPEALDGWASAYTPVPGGIGVMTIAMLMANTWEAMEAHER